MHFTQFLFFTSLYIARNTDEFINANSFEIVVLKHAHQSGKIRTRYKNKIKMYILCKNIKM